ncbi:MAG: hypothetical protein ACN6OB_16315 [Chryseobacterium jejuense]|uniref:hypothetical protein n=1 Tax=Chryseobacterium jejuense TaxID=445960 RepID=UPI003D0BAD93
MKTQIILFRKELSHCIWRLLLLWNVVISSFSDAQVCIGSLSIAKRTVVIGFSSIETEDQNHIVYSVIKQNSDTKSKAFIMFGSYHNIRAVNRVAVVLKRDKPFKIVTIKPLRFLLRPPPFV